MITKKLLNGIVLIYYEESRKKVRNLYTSKRSNTMKMVIIRENIYKDRIKCEKKRNINEKSILRKVAFQVTQHFNF